MEQIKVLFKDFLNNKKKEKSFFFVFSVTIKY